MAKEPDPVLKTVLELEQEVTCSICHDHYQEPKLLPCCHYYCKQCILLLSGQYPPNQPFPCPDCREPTLLPGNDPNRLSTAFFINRMKELHSKMEKAHNTSQQKCANHDEPMKILCFDCNQLICRDCTVIEHAGHKFEFVKKAAPEIRKKLSEHLFLLKNLLPDLNSAVRRVEDTKLAIQAEKKLIEKQVNDKFQELHDTLEQCKIHVLKESQDIVERKIEKLTIQEKDLDLSMGCVQSVVEYVEQTFENASDEELITMQKQVVNRIDTVVTKGRKEANADPVEKVDFGIEVFFSEELKALCKNNVAVYENYCCIGNKNAEVNKPVTTTLHLPKRINQKTDPEIKATLKRLVDNTSLQLDTLPVIEGMYSIEYTPKVRGRYHLQITVDCQPITENPFSVFAKLPVTELKEPIRILRTVNEPWYISFTSSSKLVVSSYNNSIVILNSKGERLRSISKSQHGFRKIRGIAVDNEDNIYASDEVNHCLYKFDPSGKLLQRHDGKKGTGHGELGRPRGVAVAGDRVFMCDQGNHRVQVFTTELEPVLQFGTRGIGDGQFNKPQDISVDNEGMLYVTDYSNHRVQVFSKDGQFVHSFGEKEQEKLNGPRGVCVDRDFVYVVEFNNECVSVFTRDGQFVTSFGKGHIREPIGVTVDTDGFVYVCSSGHIFKF